LILLKISSGLVFIENWACHNETIEAKLRNQMGAIFSLPDTVMAYEERDSDKIKEIMFRQAKTANESRPVVKEMLVSIESQNEKRFIQGQIDILNEHIEHPNKPGYKRHDILDKIKYLEENLKNLA
jgi:hypothetical protein